MRDFARKILKRLLSSFAKEALQKHDTDVIVITGIYGTRIARELLYTLLADRQNVRRNTTEIWWDFSVPLNILGYNDESRSLLRWLLFLIKVKIKLLTVKPHKSTLILNINNRNLHIADYWLQFLQPKQLLILNALGTNSLIEKLLKATHECAGQVFVSEAAKNNLNKLVKKEDFVFGNSDKADLQVHTTTSALSLVHNNERITIPTSVIHPATRIVLAGSISVALSYDYSLEELGYNVLKFTLPANFLSLVETKLHIS